MIVVPTKNKESRAIRLGSAAVEALRAIGSAKPRR
jgi:hypothetical protein